MESLAFVIVAVALLGFGLVSARVQSSMLTPPMAFVGFGLLVGSLGLGLLHIEMADGPIHLMAELTLVLVLFADASRIDLKLLRREHDLPVRLLAIGMPLTIILGTFLGILLLPGIGPWGAAVLATVLAPTDAALGQAVVSSPKVPVRIRQALNVESGLNDGIALPVVLILLSVGCASADPASLTFWLRFTTLQLVLGPLVGIAVGLIGGKLVDQAVENRWMSGTFERLSALGLALLAFAGAELVGGNGFIAAFCAGLVLGNTARKVCDELYEFAEAEGQLLALLVFLAFGALMVPEALHHVDLSIVLYALGSLTLIRMLPVFLSLLGTGVQRQTVLFLGWFGPRGLASILFALLVVEGSELPSREMVLTVALVTVLFSVFAHGLSANPGSSWYSRHTEQLDQVSPERATVSEMPLRVSPKQHG